MKEPKTRNEMIETMNRRIFSKINGMMQDGWADLLAEQEVEHADTTSDQWYDLAAAAIDAGSTAEAADLLAIAKLALNRNAYHDGLPFCPLCGKLGNPEHNGAPVIEGNVCEACNQRKIIPARIRAAQEAA